MITCCEIALASIVANVFCLAIFRNYYIKIKGLTVELKKKNGHELELIANLKTKDDKKQEQIDDLKKEVESLKISQKLKSKS